MNQKNSNFNKAVGQTVDLLNTKLISISGVSKLLPSSPHVSSIWRWIEKGVRGHKLQSWLVGGKRFTTEEAVLEFLLRINGQAPSLTSTSREKAIAQAEKELADLGM